MSINIGKAINEARAEAKDAPAQEILLVDGETDEPVAVYYRQTGEIHAAVRDGDFAVREDDSKRAIAVWNGSEWSRQAIDQKVVCI